MITGTPGWLQDYPHRAMTAEDELLVYPRLPKRPRIATIAVVLVHILKIVTEFCELVRLPRLNEDKVGSYHAAIRVGYQYISG